MSLLLAAAPGDLPFAASRKYSCRQCSNLTAAGRSLAAARGDLPYLASRKYSPVPDVLKRCEGYRPGPDDADRRPGHERWPYLIAESKPHPHSAGAAKPTPEMNVA